MGHFNAVCAFMICSDKLCHKVDQVKLDQITRAVLSDDRCLNQRKHRSAIKLNSLFHVGSGCTSHRELLTCQKHTNACVLSFRSYWIKNYSGALQWCNNAIFHNKDSLCSILVYHSFCILFNKYKRTWPQSIFKQGVNPTISHASNTVWLLLMFYYQFTHQI